MSQTCPYCFAENSDLAIACIQCGSSFVATSHLSSGLFLHQKHYQIERVIGEGGFGITYKGRDLAKSRIVAIKENWPERATRQGTTVIWHHSVTPKNRQVQLEKFATEAQYLAKCVHPNIVQVYDWFEENNTAYVVMEFLSGKTLSTVIAEEGPLSPDRVKRYFLQMAHTLRVIHSINLLHRDIKPDNIILNEGDRPILIDFGATKEFIAGQTRQMSVTLTPGYAPLEQYSYRGKRWPATDIYALCASMYELLTGQLPPPAVERVTTDTLIPPGEWVSGLDPRLEAVILQGLKIRVEERFQTVDELIAAIGAGSQLARLIPLPPSTGKAEFILDRTPMIVGRLSPDAEVVDISLDSFPGSDTVSRQHAVLYQENNQWKIRDLTSLNGVFVKRSGQSAFQKITTPELIQFGDAISFGKVRFLFQSI